MGSYIILGRSVYKRRQGIRIELPFFEPDFRWDVKRQLCGVACLCAIQDISPDKAEEIQVEKSQSTTFRDGMQAVGPALWKIRASTHSKNSVFHRLRRFSTATYSSASPVSACPTPW